MRGQDEAPRHAAIRTRYSKTSTEPTGRPKGVAQKPGVRFVRLEEEAERADSREEQTCCREGSETAPPLPHGRGSVPGRSRDREGAVDIDDVRS